jgi:P4 family phage/plasmid primase-like protien
MDKGASSEARTPGPNGRTKEAGAVTWTKGYEGLPLLPHHAELLVTSSISLEVARARRYRSVTNPHQLEGLGFGPSQRCFPALLLPVWGVTGQVVTYQLRPDRPRTGRNGKAIKYETPLSARMALDVPPMVHPLISDPKQPLFITEGLRKADAAVSHGLCCVALLGVWNFRGTNKHGGKVALADWESVALNGRQTYLCFDSDVMVKPQVHAALARLKAFLESRGAIVALIYLPPGEGGAKNGLDDFLSNRGTVADLLKLASPHLLSQLTDPARTIPLTDLGNAERLVARFRADIRFVPQWGWMVWEGKRWARDEGASEMMRRAVSTVRSMYDDISKLKDSRERQSLADHVMRSESAPRLEAMVKLAQHQVRVHASDFDRDPWLLNVLNGTLDLRTGTLRPHRREDLITKLASLPFEPDALAPAWDRFVRQIMADNNRLVVFLQRATGYSLTGVTSEQVLFIAYGVGANGKSTFLKLISEVLGDYAVQTPSDTLMVKREGAISNDLARLQRARLVTAIETEDGRRLAEALVKQLTGGDPVPARFLYREFFEFVPEFKLFLVANHKPRIRGTDHAVWRRIRLVPFEVVFDPPDKGLRDRLRAELPGILAWAVRGCLDWQRNGLGLPEEIRDATETYRRDEDALAQFLEEVCIQAPTARVRFADLYAAYTAWCEQNGERPLSTRSLGMKLAEKGFAPNTGGTRVWKGLGLIRARGDRDDEDNTPRNSQEFSPMERKPAASSALSPLSVGDDWGEL